VFTLWYYTYYSGMFLLSVVHELRVFFEWQMSTDAHSIASQLNSSGLLRTQGLIGGKWQDAYDGKTIKVFHSYFYFPLLFFFNWFFAKFKGMRLLIRFKLILLQMIIVCWCCLYFSPYFIATSSMVVLFIRILVFHAIVGL
jgi:hypothetical protein